MIREELMAKLLGALALALVAGALGFQYLGHLAPCEMCHWQRWPHIAAAVIALLIVPFWKESRAVMAAVVILLTAVIGLTAAHQWERWPFALLLCAVLIGVTFWKEDRPLAVIILLLGLSGLIGAYQFGMQMGLLPGPAACTVTHPYIMGSGAPPPEVSCNAVTWSLFGLSLAAYNAIFSLGGAAIGALALTRKA